MAKKKKNKKSEESKAEEPKVEETKVEAEEKSEPKEEKPKAKKSAKSELTEDAAVVARTAGLAKSHVDKETMEMLKGKCDKEIKSAVDCWRDGKVVMIRVDHTDGTACACEV